MAKRPQILYRIIGIFVLMISCINAEYWKMPAATDIQNARETCQVLEASYENLLSNPNTENDIRCISTALGLWHDQKGFNAKRLAKLFTKHQQNNEIIVVVTFCNDSTRQMNLSKWATESYECFAQGRMGKWIENYLRNVYKLKLSKS